MSREQEDVRYALPEIKLLQLLYNSMVYGFVFAVLMDEPYPPGTSPEEDYDPMDKAEGTAKWAQDRSQYLRKHLRRYRLRHNT